VSELLDGLARSLAEPMPRRRALRVVAATIGGAIFSGHVVNAAATSSGYGCPNPGDLYCPGVKCPGVGEAHYGDVCCPGPDATKYWECDCKPGVGGYNGCKRKPGCNLSCGSGCCDSATEQCCSSGYCIAKDMVCCGKGACPSGTHCCHTLKGKNINLTSGEAVRCCPTGWACCQDHCCMPGTYCLAHGDVNQSGTEAKYGAQGYMCSKGNREPFAKRGTMPIPWAKTIPAPPSN